MAHWFDNMTGHEICDNCMEKSGRHRYGDAACRVASFTSIAAYHATNKFLSKQKLPMPATNIVPVPFASWYNNVKSPLDVCTSCGGTAGSNHFMPNGQCLDNSGRALMTFFTMPHWYSKVKSADVCALCGGTAGSDHGYQTGECHDSKKQLIKGQFFTPITNGKSNAIFAMPLPAGSKQILLSGQYLVWDGKNWVPEISNGSTDTTHSTATKRYDQDKECPCGLLAKTCDYHKD
jgi:hypothetical protein